MTGKGLTAGLLAAVGILAWSGVSRAEDTIRLNMVDQAPARNLVDDGRGAETIRTWHHGFGWGGYGGFGMGGYRGFGMGYGGLYRPYYGFGLGYGGLGYGGLGYGRFGYGLGLGGLGYGRFGYGLGLGGLGLGGLGYGGLGYGLGYGGMGYGGMGFGGMGYGLGGYRFGFGGMYPGFGIGYGGMFGPCTGTTAGAYTLNIPSATLGTPLPGAPAAAPRQVPPEETFPYDGGPATPVPQTKDAPPPQRSVPLEGRSVSLPRATPKWNFPAYGETARRTTRASDRTYLTRGDSKKGDAR